MSSLAHLLPDIIQGGEQDDGDEDDDEEEREAIAVRLHASSPCSRLQRHALAGLSVLLGLHGQTGSRSGDQ